MEALINHCRIRVFKILRITQIWNFLLEVFCTYVFHPTVNFVLRKEYSFNYTVITAVIAGNIARQKRITNVVELIISITTDGVRYRMTIIFNLRIFWSIRFNICEYLFGIFSGLISIFINKRV